MLASLVLLSPCCEGTVCYVPGGSRWRREVPRVCWEEEEGGGPRLLHVPGQPYCVPGEGGQEQVEDIPLGRSTGDRWRGPSWGAGWDHWKDGTLGEEVCWGRNPDNKQNTNVNKTKQNKAVKIED